MDHNTEIKSSLEKMCYDRTKDADKDTLLWLEPYGWLAQHIGTTYVGKRIWRK